MDFRVLGLDGVQVAQLSQNSPGSALADQRRLKKVTRPSSGEALVLQIDRGDTVDLSAIADQTITLVQAGDRLIILFQDRGSVVLKGYFGTNGTPIDGVDLMLSPQQTVLPREFAGLFPISNDLSILPAAGPASANPTSSALWISDPRFDLDTSNIDSRITSLLANEGGASSLTADLQTGDILDGQPLVLSAQTGIVLSEGGGGGITVGEGAVASVAGQLAYSFGPDGMSSSAPIAFSTSSLPTLTSFGVPLVYHWATGSLTLTASAAGRTIFTLVVTDPATGAFTFNLSSPIDHLVGASPVGSTSFALSFTIADFDGDTASGSVLLTIADDAPLANVGTASTVEDEAVNSGNDEADGLAATAGASLNIAWGSDNANDGDGQPGDRAWGSDNANDGDGQPGDRAVAFTNATVTLADGFGPTLTSLGQAVTTTVLASGELVGYTGAAVPTATGDAQVVFFATLSDAANGSYSFTLVKPLDHAAGSAENDLSLTFAYTATDSDGDAASNTFTVAVRDDAAMITAPVTSAIEEAGDNPTVVTQSLDISWGSDNANNNIGQPGERSVVFEALQAGLAGLTSYGEAIQVTILSDGALVGYTGAIAPTTTSDPGVVFHATLSDAANGSYNFSLVEPLDHPAPATGVSEHLLVIAFTATDSDGDTASSSFTVTIDAAGNITGANDTIDYSGIPGGVFINLADASQTQTGQTVAANTATDIAGVTPAWVGIDDLGVDIVHATGTDASDIIVGGGEANTLLGGGSSDLILGGAGSDVITGGAGDDDITGGADDDNIDSGTGDDIIRYLVGSDGQDIIDGGDNDDQVDITGTSGDEVFTVTTPATALPTTFDVDTGSPAGTDLAVTNVETLHIDGNGGASDTLTLRGADGSGQDDVIAVNGDLATLNADINGGLTVIGLDFDALTINGQGGDDTIDGSAFAGDATLIGGDGHDNLTGGTGGDRLIGDDGRDTLTGGLGDDSQFGGNDQDLFVYAEGDGMDTIEGGEGIVASDLDTIEITTSGHATVDVRSAESFLIDLGSNGSNEIDALEIEAVEITSGAGAGHILTIEGFDADLDDPLADMPGDERMTFADTPGGFVATLAEAGETITGTDFEQLLVFGRQGDDDLDLRGLGNAPGSNSLDAGLLALQLDGGEGSDRFIFGPSSHAATVIGGDMDDAGFGGDTVEIAEGGSTRVTHRAQESFEVDILHDASVDVDATEIERVEANGTAAANEHLLIEGTDLDSDPLFPQDERITLEDQAIDGFTATFAEFGEVVAATGFERLLVDGRDGDDVIDATLLKQAGPSGLSGSITDVQVLGGRGSDRFMFASTSHRATVTGGETGDGLYGGDAIELVAVGSTTVTLQADEQFEVDFGADATLDVTGSEIERVEASGGAGVSDELVVQGRDVDADPSFPQDERIVLVSDPITGFSVTFAENAEVVASTDYEILRVEGRQGDDVIDATALDQSASTGLAAGIGALNFYGQDGTDRFMFGVNSHAAMVVGGETGDSTFGGDTVEIVGSATTTVTYRDAESFTVDVASDAAIDVEAVEIERIEISGTALANDELVVYGGTAIGVLPGDETINITDEGLTGFAVTFGNYGEVVAGTAIESLTIDGRDGDDLIDAAGLTAASGVAKLIVDVGSGKDIVNLSNSGIDVSVLNFEVGSGTGVDTLDLGQLLVTNPALTSDDIKFSDGATTKTLTELETAGFNFAGPITVSAALGVGADVAIAALSLNGATSGADALLVSFTTMRTLYV